MTTLETRRNPNLQVGRWAAIVVDGKPGIQTRFGAAVTEEAIPPALRRRMGPLERLAVCCTLGVVDTASATDHLTYCSRHGNLETLCTLLNSIAARQPMSPMAFSGSVHNAAPGLVGQIRKERLNHTALAAGRRTLVAGLTESYGLLAADGCRDVTVTFADLALPEAYRKFEDEDKPGVALAMRLTLAADNGAAIDVEQGRAGALTVLDGLMAGTLQLALGESSWEDLEC